MLVFNSDTLPRFSNSHSDFEYDKRSAVYASDSLIQVSHVEDAQQATEDNIETTTIKDQLLPSSTSPHLHLTEATAAERTATWVANSVAWRGPLSQEDYVSRELHFTKLPLVRNAGIRHWILVDKRLPADARPILGACETIRKHALVRYPDGSVKEVACQGITSVFCEAKYRGRGYASRMLGELVKTFEAGRSGCQPCKFSVLWSDIGKEFYAGLGWIPHENRHIEFLSKALKVSKRVRLLRDSDLKHLCDLDVDMVTRATRRIPSSKIQATILPTHDQIQWHHGREDFICRKIFGREPDVRGAIIGHPSHRMWVIWARYFYGPLYSDAPNTLCVLRLVVEDENLGHSFHSENGDRIDESLIDETGHHLQQLLQAAQTQAEEWKLRRVELWNSTPLVDNLLRRTNFKHDRVERERNGVASLMWHGQDGRDAEVEWVGNEKYCWC
jgi:GNAT superfamily N-acetyltransferase